MEVTTSEITDTPATQQEMNFNDEEAFSYLVQSCLYMQLPGNGKLSSVDRKSILGKATVSESLFKRFKEYMQKYFGITVYGRTQPFLCALNELKPKSCAYDKEDVDDLDEETYAKQGLLVAIILLLYVNRPRGKGIDWTGVTEVTLWAFLEQMNVLNDGSFGAKVDIEKLIAPSYTAEFINQGWFEFKKKFDVSGNMIVYYTFGKRFNEIEANKDIQWVLDEVYASQ